MLRLDLHPGRGGDVDHEAVIELERGEDAAVPRNEDNFLEDEGRALFAVADGMGGHVAGELASREAIRALDRTLSDGALSAEDRMRNLVDALLGAHEAVIEAGRSSAGTAGMGTTAVVVHIDGQDGALSCAHVGDSRAYVLQRGRVDGRRFVRTTEDHARWMGGARRLTQAIGASHMSAERRTTWRAIVRCGRHVVA